MMITPEMLHYMSASLALALAAIGGGIGQGLGGGNIIRAMQRQPSAVAPSIKAMIIGLALIESGIIIALVIALLSLFTAKTVCTYGTALADVGIACAIGFSSLSVSIASSFVLKGASESISRQPLSAQKILSLMIIAQSILETPVIFALIITLAIKGFTHAAMTTLEGLICCAAGTMVGIGSIGSAIGQALFSSASCRSVGLNRLAYDKIFPFSLINQAVIETPMIFCLLIAFLMLKPITQEPQLLLHGSLIVTAAFTMSCGAFGTSIGLGFVGSRGCYEIVEHVDYYQLIIKTTLLAEAFIESSVIYAMIIALFLMARVI